jgi:hypothetical protein
MYPHWKPLHPLCSWRGYGPSCATSGSVTVLTFWYVWESWEVGRSTQCNSCAMHCCWCRCLSDFNSWMLTFDVLPVVTVVRTVMPGPPVYGSMENHSHSCYGPFSLGVHFENNEPFMSNFQFFFFFFFAAVNRRYWIGGYGGTTVFGDLR